MRKIQHQIPTPPYIQVAEAIRDSIRSGELKVGDELPKQQHLREHFNISPGTMHKAMSLLAATGEIVRRQGLPALIGLAEPARDPLREVDQLRKLIDRQGAAIQALHERLFKVEASTRRPTFNPGARKPIHPSAAPSAAQGAQGAQGPPPR